MTMSVENLSLIMGGGAFAVAALVILALSDSSSDLDKRLARVEGQTKRAIDSRDRTSPNSVRSTKDSAIPLLDRLVKMLPNPDKLRARLAATGKGLSLGEYLLMNALSVLLFYMVFHFFDFSKSLLLPMSLMLGLGVPHAVTGFMGARRIKKFVAHFPEAIDTMCRGIRSGLPITESIGAVGREMPNPIGIEFHRISDGVRMGKTLENSMWEVATRINAPEFRFLIVAMAIQKETGGNLAETLGNLAELIRKRRQLRLKVKAMSSEAKASAMIIGSLPFIMFLLLMIVNPEYVSVLFNETRGRILLGIGLGWMSIGWGVMLKMIHFEL
ncbi:MAG: type II secretion system F family protein [Bdellovibrionales bacterium]